MISSDLSSNLHTEDPREICSIVSRLVSTASPTVISQLADLVEADFTGIPLIWVDHWGNKRSVLRTTLNLSTVRQQWALLALTKMPFSKATAALNRWTPPSMILIPAGSFTMGSTEYRDEEPVHQVWLDAFWIDRYPVTNAQWAAFMESGGYQRREFWSDAGWLWKEGRIPEPDEWNKHCYKLDHPVRGVCWYEALAYARWTSKSLLGEAQWEKAARGTDGRRYPWGNELYRDRCNVAESKIDDTTPVGLYSPEGDSPYGVADMAGNVREWCFSLYAPYPYNSTDGRDMVNADGDRIMRGGAFDHNAWYVRTACRSRHHPHHRRRFRGVRVGLAAHLADVSHIIAPYADD